MSDPLDGRSLCHINLARGYRGGERQSELLIAELARRGVRQQTLIHFGRATLLRERSRRHRASLTVVEAQGSRARSMRWRARDHDIIHAHEAKAFYAALPRPTSSLRYALRTDASGSRIRSGPQSARRIAYARAGSLVGVSDAVARNVHRLYPDHRGQGRARCACEALPSDPASADRNSANRLHRQDVIIGHIGALDDAHKGQRTLLAVARRASVERPEWCFVLCGDGKDQDILRRSEAADLENVSFCRASSENPG